MYFEFLYDLLNWQSNAISPLSCSGLSCANGRHSLCAWGSATPANMTTLASPVMNCLANMASEIHLLCFLCDVHGFRGDALPPDLSESYANIAARVRIVMYSRSASNGTHRRSISHRPWRTTRPVMLVVESTTIRIANSAK